MLNDMDLSCNHIYTLDSIHIACNLIFCDSIRSAAPNLTVKLFYYSIGMVYHNVI